MRLIPWSPLMDMQEFDDAFKGPANFGFAPAMDIYQDKDNVIVETPVVNVDPDKVNITIENDVLTVEGQSEKKSEVEDKSYYRKEVRYGSFSRSVSLPVSVNGEQAEAEYKDGILKVTIPKAPQAKKKTIKVKTKK